MALIKCTKCGKEISVEGIACPHCGAPLPVQPAKKTFTIRAFMGFLFIVLVIAVFSFFILPAFCPRVADNIEELEFERWGYSTGLGNKITIGRATWIGGTLKETMRKSTSLISE